MQMQEITETDATGDEITETVPFYSTQMISICSSMQFFNEETLKCEACPENEGTTGFQQSSCKSCGDIWFDSKDEPNSLEAIISTELCGDPEAIYEVLAAERAEAARIEAERIAREQAIRDAREQEEIEAQK